MKHMTAEEARVQCREQMVTAVTRGSYKERAVATNIMQAMCVHFDLYSELVVEEVTTIDYWGKEETEYRIRSRY